MEFQRFFSQVQDFYFFAESFQNLRYFFFHSSSCVWLPISQLLLCCSISLLLLPLLEPWCRLAISNQSPLSDQSHHYRYTNTHSLLSFQLFWTFFLFYVFCSIWLLRKARKGKVKFYFVFPTLLKSTKLRAKQLLRKSKENNAIILIFLCLFSFSTITQRLIE